MIEAGTFSLLRLLWLDGGFGGRLILISANSPVGRLLVADGRDTGRP